MEIAARPTLLRQRRVQILVLITVLALIVTGISTFALARDAHPDTMARYPGGGAQDVPRSTEIHLRLTPDWASASDELHVEVTDATGERVPGLTTVDPAGLLSFVPEDPLAAGRTTVDIVHGPIDQASDGTTVDTWSFTVGPMSDPSTGPGGSLLLIARDGTMDTYLAEILRAEGFMSFRTAGPDEVTAELLADHAVAIVGAGSASAVHSEALEQWVVSGGDLVVMRPGARLAGLSGLAPTDQTVDDGYLTIDTDTTMGAGLTAEPLQFHGEATVYEGASDPTAGDVTAATLVAQISGSPDPASPSDSPSPDPAIHPGVSWKGVGSSGGQVVTFSYDLAESVLLTRQGNPEWSGEERDGSTPIRSNDLFTGADGHDDHLDLSRIGIPQADEQMRLLSNALILLHDDTGPLPRFWYLPHGENAAIVMTADDHGTDDGTRQSFQRMMALDAPGCQVRLWECHRATSWFYPTTSLDDAQAARFQDQGFDLGVHATTGCEDWTEESLGAALRTALLDFREEYPSLNDQRGHRLHCIANSEWLTQSVVGSRWGIRLDMNYYNWPPDWIQDRAGYMTGSALPMRFADVDGSIIDVFQQETHLVNETWNGSADAIDQLIDAANDERGYYGAFGTHYDFSDDFDRQLMQIALERDTPMVSAQQLLDFIEGRHGSSFTPVPHFGPAVDAGSDSGTFKKTWELRVDDRAEGLLRAMVPTRSGEHVLVSVDADGSPVDFRVRQIKGISYAFFEATNGRFTASYR